MGERRTELVPIDDLVFAPWNPKTHDAATLDASFDRFGFVEPATCDDRTGRLVSGHGRVTRLRARRAEGKPPPSDVVVGDDGRWLVPVNVGWASRDDDEATAAVVALNRIGERGGWDKANLVDVLNGLTARGLAGVGFDPAELDDLRASLLAGDLTFDTGDGAAPAETFEELAESYRHAEVRSMVLDFPLDDFHALVTLAAPAREALGVGSNADLFVAMLRRWAEREVAPCSS